MAFSAPFARGKYPSDCSGDTTGGLRRVLAPPSEKLATTGKLSVPNTFESIFVNFNLSLPSSGLCLSPPLPDRRATTTLLCCCDVLVDMSSETGAAAHTTEFTAYCDTSKARRFDVARFETIRQWYPWEKRHTRRLIAFAEVNEEKLKLAWKKLLTAR